MSDNKMKEIFNQDTLVKLLPPGRSDLFFEALYGDASEGAYDISLHFAGMQDEQTLGFEIHLNQRPGKCLACNLTYGLPEVFSRHPLINLAGVASEVGKLMNRGENEVSWNLGTTQSTSSELNIIPFTITLT